MGGPQVAGGAACPILSEKQTACKVQDRLRHRKEPRKGGGWGGAGTAQREWSGGRPLLLLGFLIFLFNHVTVFHLQRTQFRKK